MHVVDILRRWYRKLKVLPVIGPLIVKLRYRQWPALRGRAAELQQLRECLDAQAHALSGLRLALSDLRQELYDHVHRQNLARDELQRALNDRLEFIRQELFWELRYGAQQTRETAVVGARIINPPKIDQQRAARALRLNVGCGHKPDPDRINIDARELPGVDIVCAAQNLPFDEGSVHEIYAAHLLEHFPHEQVKRQVLPHWCTRLAPGGTLRLVVPDAAAMIDGYVRGEITLDELRLVLYGGQEYDGDFHHTLFTPESLASLLRQQGLVDVQIVARGRRSGLCYECEVMGSKP